MTYENHKPKCAYLEWNDVEILIAKVDPVIFGDVTEQVHDSVEVGNGNDLSSDVVIQSIDGVGVKETVTNPQACERRVDRMDAQFSCSRA